MIDKGVLQNTLNEALHKKAGFAGVRIETRGMQEPEYIINPHANIAQKLVYYNGAYNDDLTLKTYDGIKITAVAYGNTATEVMEKLGEADA
jgi:hypothetical protein